MYKNTLTLFAAAILALPLLNCNDAPTALSRARVQAETQGLILHEVKTATDFLTFIHVGSIGVDSARAIVNQECARRGIGLGGLSIVGGDLAGVAFRPSYPINPFCGCPKQPVGGAPPGYTCRLTRSDCDETGRACAYTCVPIQTNPT